MARKGLLSNPWLWVGLAAAGFFWYRSRSKPTTVDDIVTPDDTAPTLPAPNPGSQVLPGGSLTKRDLLAANGWPDEVIDIMTTQEFETVYTFLHDYVIPGNMEQIPQQLFADAFMIGLKYKVAKPVNP